ncbi:hypothetical protein DRJ00_04345, partial [Candidatus Aerophobetes bacterium]
VTEKTLPGALSELAGIEVEEYSSLPSDEESKVEIVEEEIGNKTYSCSTWCDVIRPKKQNLSAFMPTAILRESQPLPSIDTTPDTSST